MKNLYNLQLKKISSPLLSFDDFHFRHSRVVGLNVTKCAMIILGDPWPCMMRHGAAIFFIMI
jgi:hypothetical protein